jgi:NadR type nicotinamide-nucleotide adenylyltransferase
MKAIRKIVVIGGESTGKSTLCKQLANHYRTSWVPEFAREYLHLLARPYRYEDLFNIAKGQIAAEDRLIGRAHKFLFCDTDLHVLKTWSEHKYKRCDPYVLNEITERKYDAYLITAPDFPWQDDPLREHPTAEMRNYFFELYCELIKSTGLPYTILVGNEQQRLSDSITFLDQLPQD